MKNANAWRPSKYVFRNGVLAGSRDRAEVGVGSRLISDLIARAYEINLPKHASGRLLDLGCGKVPLYLAYKSLVAENVCVDWQNTLHKNEYLDHECDLTVALPFAGESFDTIILSDVLEHIPEPALLWQEIARLLTAKGKLLMNVPFYYSIHEQPHDYYRYTEFGLRRFVEAAGLRLLDLEAIGGAPEIVADIFAKNILRLPYAGAPLSMFSQWMTHWLVTTGPGARISRATRSNFPIAYFLVAEKP